MKEHLKEYIDRSTTPSVRGLRILLEYFYATEIFEEISRENLKVISVFGSARTKPHSVEYQMAHRLGGLLYKRGFAVVTGASRGIMQAANQGVADQIAQKVKRNSTKYQDELRRHSVGLSISLPMESATNPYVGIEATFHYFMVRKFFFGTLSSGFVACEGGWGTRDELYEILTLVQTGKSPLMPIVYLSPDTKHLEDDLQHALKKKYISPEDLDLIYLAKTPEKAAEVIANFYRVVDKILYDREQAVKVLLKSKPSLSTMKRVEKILSAEGKIQIEWDDREMRLLQYNPYSYGYLRRAVDALNSYK